MSTPLALPIYAIVLISIAAVIVLVGWCVLLADMARVWWFVRHYHDPRADPVKVANYRKRMEDAYFDREEEDPSSNPFRHQVTDAEFEASIKEFNVEMDRRGCTENGAMFPTLHEPFMKLLRESIGVVIAPRAVLMQVAHPYIAVAIVQHSNLERDTPKRFEKTYYHMFNMAFGKRSEAIRSARVLRRIHNRVTGKFTHPVGSLLKAGHSYSAAHTHALLWVGLALAESVMLGYTCLVSNFTDEELASLGRDASYGMMLFGIPRKLAYGTYEEFRVAIEACWQSDIITVSDEARRTFKYLLYPKTFYLKPVFAVARWATLVIMPEKLAIQYFGRKANILDQIVLSVCAGLLRFIYRWVPGPMRYVPEYSQALRRWGKSTTCCLCDPCARVMETGMVRSKDVFLKVVMPAPNEDIDIHPGTDANEIMPTKATTANAEATIIVAGSSSSNIKKDEKDDESPSAAASSKVSPAASNGHVSLMRDAGPISAYAAAEQKLDDAPL